MKNLKFTGYTNDTAKALCKGNDINPHLLCFCPASRYKKCCRDKICDKLEPTCTYDKFRFIGKKYRSGSAYNVITKADEAKIKKKLRAAMKECRPVTVTLTVEA